MRILFSSPDKKPRPLGTLILTSLGGGVKKNLFLLLLLFLCHLITNFLTGFGK